MEETSIHQVVQASGHAFVTFVNRKHYNGETASCTHPPFRAHSHSVADCHGSLPTDNKGMEQLKMLSTKECSSVELEVAAKYLALSAFHALIRYTEYGNQYTYAANRSAVASAPVWALFPAILMLSLSAFCSCRVEYQCPSAYIQLDPMTIVNLEIIQSVTPRSLSPSLAHARTVRVLIAVPFQQPARQKGELSVRSHESLQDDGWPPSLEDEPATTALLDHTAAYNQPAT